MVDHLETQLFLDLEPREGVWTYNGNHGGIGHMCGRAAGDGTGWTGEGRCDNLCYGPYIVLEPGSYDFWWYISGPEFDCAEHIADTVVVQMNVVNNQATEGDTGRAPPPIIEGNLTIRDLCRLGTRDIPGTAIDRTPLEGVFGFKSVRIHTTTPNVEFRLTVTEHCQWLLAKQMKIIRR